jgi:hypothetical protein
MKATIGPEQKSSPSWQNQDKKEYRMREISDREAASVGGGVINTGSELAAGLIMAGAAGMVGGLLGAVGGPLGSAALGVTFARYGFSFVEHITR